MASPVPAPWPDSARVVPIRAVSHRVGVEIPGEAEIMFTCWQDGTEEVTIRVFCTRAAHCGDCHCEQDHVIRVDLHTAARIRAALHDLTELS